MDELSLIIPTYSQVSVSVKIQRKEIKPNFTIKQAMNIYDKNKLLEYLKLLLFFREQAIENLISRRVFM